MNDLVKNAFDAKLVGVMSRFVFGGFGLGPGTDISRTSPSRGIEEFCLHVGMTNVRLGVVPHFALGSIADISNPASAGGDPLVLRVGDVNGWFDVRGVEISDVGITSPSSRVIGRVKEITMVFRNRFNAVRSRNPVSTPSSFQALSVLRTTRGR
jgi:hypothetical protein